MKVVLERYHGLSNDYVVFDPNKNELELNETQVRSKQVISLLLAINIVLIGVLTYVLQHT